MNLTLSNYTPADLQKIAAALESLSEDNPKLPDQLTKLADVRINRPGLWKKALLFLKIS